jgi:hypothetical protein
VITKRSWIVILVGVNLLLLGSLLLEGYSLPSALAQSGVRGGEFICVTAKPAGQIYDVLYVLDLPSHKLHGFYPSLPQSKQLTHAEPRDLKKDFGRR